MQNQHMDFRVDKSTAGRLCIPCHTWRSKHPQVQACRYAAYGIRKDNHLICRSFACQSHLCIYSRQESFVHPVSHHSLQVLPFPSRQRGCNFTVSSLLHSMPSRGGSIQLHAPNLPRGITLVPTGASLAVTPCIIFTEGLTLKHSCMVSGCTVKSMLKRADTEHKRTPLSNISCVAVQI